MSEFQLTECQCCGNRLGSNFKEKEDGFVCKSCGVWFRYESNEEKRGCADGYKHLRKYQFEDACEEFESVICNYPGSIDARWGLLLARFGVVFIKGFFDNVTEPIYCFPEYDELEEGVFRKQREYGEMLDMLDKMAQNNDSESAKKALELRYFYEKKAKEIDRAIKKFSECKRNTDREVFICVKISAATEKNPQLPGETEDCQVAKKLYAELEKRGTSTFFSYRTLKNEVNSDDLIWLNLVKSKKMILIGSERDYLESAWVKSEWKRWKFLERLDDLYVLVLKHNHEYPKEVLPHELRKSQIYTLDTYDKLLADICGEEEVKESEEDKFRAAVEAEILKRRAVEEAAAEQLRKEQEAAAEQLRKEQEAAAEQARKAQEAAAEQARKAQEAAAAEQARKAQEAAAAEQARKAQEAAAEQARKEQEAAAEQARKAQEAAAAEQARKAQSTPSIITCRACGARFEYSRAEKRDGFIICDFCGGKTLDTFAPTQASASSVQNGKIVYSNGREEIFPSGITKIAHDAYKENNDIVSVILPSTVTEIDSWAFWNCKNLQSIVIPEGVKTIANGAFSGCEKLTGISLPASLAEIKGNPFMGCNLKTFAISPNNTHLKYENNCIYSIDGKKIINCIFKNNLFDFKVPSGVTSIESLAFYNAVNLREITIPKSVTFIGTNAFSGCQSIKTVNYEGSSADWKKITVSADGKGNETLLNAAINYLYGSATPQAGSANANGSITYKNGSSEIIPYGTTEIKNKLDYVNAVSVVLPASVKIIRDAAFRGASALASVTIPEGVTTIGKNAFFSCKSLTRINIPRSVTTIGEYAFSDCKALSSLNLSEGLTEIGNGAFSRCSVLTTVKIPNGVTAIKPRTFDYCPEITRVDLPVSLTSIGVCAFDRSTKLRNIYYGGTREQWESIKINAGNSNIYHATLHFAGESTANAISSPTYRREAPPAVTAPVTNAKTNGKIVFSSGREEILPYGMTEIAEKAYYNNKEVVSVVFPSSLVTIKKYSFCLCSNLKSITLPEGLISIDTGAFSYCSQLETPALPKSLENLGTDAFQSCYNIKNIFMPESLKTVGENPFAHSLGTLSISSANRNFKVVNNALFSYDGTKLFFCMKSNSDNFTFSVPEGVERIEAKAFYDLGNLSDVSLPNTLISIGTCAFAHCKKLRTLALPQSLRELGGQVFSGCNGLETASVSEGVSKLSYCTFKECTSLSKVYLPRSLTLIDWDAFEKCSSLRDVYYSGSRSEWKNIKIGKGNSKLNGLVGKANIHFR